MGTLYQRRRLTDPCRCSLVAHADPRTNISGTGSCRPVIASTAGICIVPGDVAHERRRSGCAERESQGAVSRVLDLILVQRIQPLPNPAAAPPPPAAAAAAPSRGGCPPPGGYSAPAPSYGTAPATNTYGSYGTNAAPPAPAPTYGATPPQRMPYAGTPQQQAPPPAAPARAGGPGGYGPPPTQQQGGYPAAAVAPAPPPGANLPPQVQAALSMVPEEQKVSPETGLDCGANGASDLFSKCSCKSCNWHPNKSTHYHPTRERASSNW